jgi:outer membrane biosynthesis protein TonB
MKSLENSKNTSRKFAVIGVLLSLLLHFAFLFFFSWFFFSQDDPDQGKDYQVVTLEKVEKSKPEKKKSPDTYKITDRNSNPDEESVNRDDPENKKEIKVKKEQTKAPVNSTTSKPKSSQKKQNAKVKKLEKLKNSEVAVKPEKEDETQKNKGEKGENKKKKQVSLPASSETELKLSLSQQEVRKLLGEKARDQIKGVKSGEQTILKTKRWLGASFFIRLKEAVSQVWSPGKVYRIHDPDGSFYGFKNWLTVLKISLTPQGKIKRIIITKPSGLTFLDKEAIRG